jgi:chromosome segregation ATPase
MQRIELAVDVQDAVAKAKLNDIGIKVDKLQQKKITIKTDIDGKEISKVTKLSDGLGGIVTTAERYNKAGQKIVTVTSQVTQATDKAGKQADKTSKAFTLLHTVFLRFAHTAISALTKSFKEALSEMKNVDTQLVTISRITQTNIEELDELKNKAYEVGQAYGVLASDYLSASAAFTRAGYREQAEQLAELSSKMQIAGQVSADTANQLLIATDKAYKLNGNYEELSNTMDKMTVIDHNYATSVEKIAEGMGLVAPIAAQAHMSIDELIASLGTITAVSQRGGAEAARALRALILSIIKDTTTEIDEGVTWTVEEINSLQDALKVYAPEVVKAAEATGSLIDPMEAIAALAKSYEDGLLTEAKLADLTSKLGGKLRASQLLSLIQNYSGMYTDMMNMMGDAIGAVDKDVDKALQSWETKLQQLKNSFTQFATGLLDTEEIKGFIDALNFLIQSIDNPEKFASKFREALSGAIKSVLQNIPSFAVLLNRITVDFSKTLISTLIKEAPHLLGEIADQLPEIISSIFGAVGSVIGEIMGNAFFVKEVTELVIKIVRGVVVGIASGIKSAFIEQLKEVTLIGLSEETKEIVRETRELKEEIASIGKETDEMSASFEEADKNVRLAEYWLGIFDELSEKTNLQTSEQEKLNIAVEKLNELMPDLGLKIDEDTGAWTKNSEAIENSIVAMNNRARAEVYYKKIQEDTEKLIEAEQKRDKYKTRREELIAERDSYDDYPLYKEAVEIYDKGLTASEQWEQASDALKEYAKNVGITAENFTGINQVIGYLTEDVDLIHAESLNKEIAAIDEHIETAEKACNEYENAINGYANAAAEATGETKDLNEEEGKQQEETKKLSSEINGLKDELDSATASLKKYKEALEGGEKGDTFKSYAEAYKKAAELFEQGLTGSNAYMSAIDLLIPADVMRELQWSYEEAGKLLGNDFIKAMFSEGGEDYGANAANYIRENIDKFKGVAIEEAGDGTFGLVVTDMEAFAESTGLTEEALWSLMDALDIFHSDATYTFEDLTRLLEVYSDSVTDIANGIKKVDVTSLVNHLVQEGKTDREIKSILGSLEKMAGIEMNYPENLDKTLQDVRDLNEEAEKNPDLEVVITSNKDEFFDELYKECKTFDGTVYIGVKKKVGTVDNFHGYGATYPSGYASGTDSARGGLALVNDGNGAELIAADGRAWIAGGGKPTITDLPQGATVYTAEETRDIFKRSGIPAFSVGIGGNRANAVALADGGGGGVHIETNNGTVSVGIPDGSGAKNKDKSGGGSKSKTKDAIDDLLSTLDKYIDKLLKKAKEALDKQLDALDAQIDALKREHDAEEDKNKLEELRLKVLEAEKKLVEAQTERTVRIFNEESGQWEWIADQKAVAEAQKALQDAKDAYEKEKSDQAYQAQLQALEDEKDRLKSEYDALADKWDSILEGLKEAQEEDVDLAKLLSQLGLGKNDKSSINDLIAAILAYEKKYSSVSSSIPLDYATAAKIMSVGYSGSGGDLLSKLLGVSSSDIGAKGQSIFNTNSNSSTVIGDTIYYINGFQVGSDMVNKPLSDILSNLAIYAG